MISLIITLIFVLLATVWDLKTRRIPNAITFSSMIIGIALNLYLSGIGGFKNSIVGLTIGILLLVIPFALGGIGAGDVKLLAAIGAINGGTFALYTFLYSSIAGAVIAVGYVFMRRQISLALETTTIIVRNIPAILRGGHESAAFSAGIKFPYGTAILVGTVAAYLLR